MSKNKQPSWSKSCAKIKFNWYIFDRQQSPILRIMTLKLLVKNGLHI